MQKFFHCSQIVSHNTTYSDKPVGKLQHYIILLHFLTFYRHLSAGYLPSCQSWRGRRVTFFLRIKPSSLPCKYFLVNIFCPNFKTAQMHENRNMCCVEPMRSEIENVHPSVWVCEALISASNTSICLCLCLGEPLGQFLLLLFHSPTTTTTTIPFCVFRALSFPTYSRLDIWIWRDSVYWDAIYSWCKVVYYYVWKGAPGSHCFLFIFCQWT